MDQRNIAVQLMLIAETTARVDNVNLLLLAEDEPL